MQLKSRHYEAPDMAQAMELCYERGWTDGLPVVPPTADRIEAMLTAAGLAADKQVTFIENRQVPQATMNGSFSFRERCAPLGVETFLLQALRQCGAELLGLFSRDRCASGK